MWEGSGSCDSAGKTPITRAAIANGRGREDQGDAVADRVYGELRRIAQAMLTAERVNHTLSATALVHEAYVRIFAQGEMPVGGTDHFRAICSTTMRRVLIDYARTRNRKKRGGSGRQTSRVGEEPIVAPDIPEFDTEIFAVNEALEKLRVIDERQFFIVHLRIYGGFSAEQTARTLGLSLRTVEREWAMAKAWLKRELKRGDTP